MVLIVPVFALSVIQEAETNEFREIPIPYGSSRPLGITVDATGTIWFATSFRPSIIAFTPSNDEFLEFPLPANISKCEIWSMTADREGRIWFGEAASNAIWVFNPREKSFKSYPIPTLDAYPFQLAFDATGTLWFTELYGGGIGELSRDLIIREYRPPTVSSGPSGFDFDADGNMWFAQEWVRQIGWFNPHSGEFREYSLDPEVLQPRGVGIDREGMIWITDSESSAIVRMNPVTLAVIPFVTSLPEYGGGSSPYFFQKDRSGNFWINERIGNKIGYLDPQSRKLIEIELPYSSTIELPGYVPPPCCKVPAGLPVVPREILAIAVAPDGDVWFTEALGNRIGVVHAPLKPPVVLEAPPFMEVSRSRETAMTIKITSHLSDASEIRVTHNYPAGAEGTAVGSLFIPSSQITKGTPYSLKVPVTLPQSASLRNATLTISVHGGRYTVSSLIRFVNEGETSNEIPLTTPVKQGIPLTGALCVCIVAVSVAVSVRKF